MCSISNDSQVHVGGVAMGVGICLTAPFEMYQAIIF